MTDKKTPVFVDIDASLMRARSWVYPDDPYITENPELSNHFVDPVYFDKKNKSFDIGFQRIRFFDVTKYLKKYPDFVNLQILYIDHNNLSLLPEPSHIPNLSYLNCSFNNLKTIPYYPELKFINFANNKVIDLSNYHNSVLEYIDCGFNPGFMLNFILPKCIHLYANNIDLTAINFELYPELKFVDCSHNFLTSIMISKSIVELNIQYNQIEVIPCYPNLINLDASFNKIQILETFPKLVNADLNNNILTLIKTQPVLTKLIANNNNIKKIEVLPMLELGDFSHNNLSQFILSPSMNFLSLQFNSIHNILITKKINNIPLSVTDFKLKEIEMDPDVYNLIYEYFLPNIKSVQVQINTLKLRQLVKKIKNMNNSILSFIYYSIKKVKPRKSRIMIFKICMEIYYKYFPIDKYSNVQEIINDANFQKLYNNIFKIYHKSIIVIAFMSSSQKKINN